MGEKPEETPEKMYPTRHEYLGNDMEQASNFQNTPSKDIKWSVDSNEF